MRFQTCLLSLCTWFTAMSAQAQENPTCIICSQPARTGHAVVWEAVAYPIHVEPCRGQWDAAVGEHRVEVLLERAQARRLSAVLWQEKSPDAVRRRSFTTLALFYLLVALTSGVLGAFGARLGRRSVPAGFCLGFLIPAVGAVLAMTLPQKR